jgi:hypothetical protein
MKRQLEPAQQVAVTDPIALSGRPYDYGDAFEVQLSEPESARPEDWVRAAMNEAPKWVDWITGALGMDGPAAWSAENTGSFRIEESTPDLLHLTSTDWLMETVMVGRRIEPTGRRLTTVLRFRRPVLARLVWALIAPLHRRMARGLVTSATLAPKP